jgi:diguanylate cyclase (GGDEF)-like protein/PAS domain S-box-containing protein
MRLADFLRSNSEPILDEWDKFAKHINPSEVLDAKGLRDHARGMLDAIATDLTNFQSELQQQEKSRGMGPHAQQTTEAELHGSSRFAEGFDVNQMMSEFRSLRACVLRLWGECVKIPLAEADDITRFNEAIDQAMAESLAYFTELKNRQTRLFEALLSSSPDLNYIIEPNGKLLYANNAFAGFFGKSTSEIVGVDFLSLCGPFVSDIGTRVQQVIAGRKTFRAEMCATNGSSDGRTFEYLLVPVLNQEGRCEAIAGSARDITERKASEERVRRSANHDPLTDLPNRSLFLERLQHEIKHAARTGLALGLLFIDLDGFKKVNDRLGHAAGDQLLQQVAIRIKNCVRDTDTVARLGGDEFTVILTDVTDPTNIDTIAAEIIGAIRRPFTLTAGEATISASMGVALYPRDCNAPVGLVSKADEAMYASKNAGRNQYKLAKTDIQDDVAPSS